MDLAAVACAIVFLAAGVAVLLFHAAASRRTDRTLVWFGIFMAVYGVRLILDTPLSYRALGLSPHRSDVLVIWIGYLIPIPILLYLRELVTGWLRQAHTATAALVLILGVVFICVDAVRGRPGSGETTGHVFVLLFVLGMAVTGAKGWALRQSLGRFEARLLLAGALTFALLALNENLVAMGALPWRWSAEPLGLLALTAAVGHITVRRVRDTEASLSEVQHELDTARRIQAGLLPARGPAVTGLRVTARFLPMTAVGGDFYDYRPTETGLAVLLADASGHGVPAALVASMVKVAALAQREHLASPALTLAGMNRVLSDALPRGFVTAALLHLGGDGSFTYGAAGHPPMLWLHAAEARVEEVLENGLLMGQFPDAEYTERKGRLDVGDRVLLYTDGALEMASPSGEEFGPSRLAESLEASAKQSLEAAADHLLTRLAAWRAEAPVSDDLTFVLAERA
jgi:sigma-B regulation protein RsbU (phosphoserine phosphatase)